MKSVRKYYSLIIILVLCTLGTFQLTRAQTTFSSPEKSTIKDFQKRAKQYVKLRQRLMKKVPKLSKDATAEQINAFKTSFQKAVQSSRIGAKQGDIFTAAATQLIRTIIKNKLQVQDRKELKETVLEADTKGVLVRINFPYPATKEQIEMLPELLLILPKLPEQLRYRFVGRNLLLVDRENELIVDYMTKALP